VRTLSSLIMELSPLQLSKVLPALREYTCDAMVGKELNSNHSGRNKAQKRIKESRLIFTTCVGAGLGLLRSENFDVVVIDEASQQTEAETLIPLAKGCQRAVLVGDHVQLRTTVQKHAIVVEFDVSLFERHYNMPERANVAKCMLDTQYRMHPDICSFSSEEFYEGKLKTADPAQLPKIGNSNFHWPWSHRKLFVQCSDPEDLGAQSKSNKGQVELCRHVIEMLRTSTIIDSAGTEGVKRPSTVAPLDLVILTPYTRQKNLLSSAFPQYPVSSIDGYQGREADIVIFVSVRCNVHYEIGFLRDMRRLNVAMTRAKVGVVIIGDKATLTTIGKESEDQDVKKVWMRLLHSCQEITVGNIEGGTERGNSV
jgi:superfamily I DNA and/or RNA helicase